MIQKALILATAASGAASSLPEGTIQEGTYSYDLVTFGFIIAAGALWVGLYLFRNRHRKGDYYDHTKIKY